LILAGCTTLDTVVDNLTDAGGPVRGNKFEKGEMKYEVNYCTLLPGREFECDVTISNYNQDKTIHIGSVDIRDDAGKEYRASINPGYGNRQYYPGERFTHKVIVNNVSMQATAVSAIDVLIDMRGGRENSFRQSFLLYDIPMRAPAPPPGPRLSNDASAQELPSTNTTPSKRMDNPTAAPLPENSAADSRTAVSPQPKSAGASPNLLVGCWKWSNGMRIEVQKGGSANNGFAVGTWKMEGNRHHTIAWPDFTGNVSLSANGQSLTGVDSMGTSSTADRLQGDPSSFVGSWRWDNGGIVTIADDGTMSAGPLKGTWSGSDNKYNTAWPIVDAISVGADGKTLSGQNQFGSFTATKMPGC